MSSFGTLFRVSTFGESHGVGVGCVVDGVPPGIKLTEDDIQPQLTRRRPGQSSLTTQRDEKDRIEILSGTENGVTLGTPIGMMVRNQDQRKFDYANTSVAPRPGHADYTYQVKYGIRASSGGGRASARETIARVAAGAVAEKWLFEKFGCRIVCWVSQVMDVKLPPDVAKQLEDNPPTRDEIDNLGALTEFENVFTDKNGNVYNADSGERTSESASGYPKSEADEGKAAYTRCPDATTSAKMAARIRMLRKEDDSTGGVVTCVITNCPVGLGEPCFDKLPAELAKAMISIPATKGFEFGSGFGCAAMRGSVHNDNFEAKVTGKKQGGTDVLTCETNNAGGSLGGISTGLPIVFRVAIKPASSISQPQQTATFDGKEHELTVKGRHDPCVLPRAPPLIEGMAAMTVADLAMRQMSRTDTPLVSFDSLNPLDF